jgi:hypothetical protein
VFQLSNWFRLAERISGDLVCRELNTVLAGSLFFFVGLLFLEKNEYLGMRLLRNVAGKPEFDNGKFHNHCERCPGFGVCIGDYREAHCGQCHEHYFTGLTGFRCGCSVCLATDRQRIAAVWIEVGATEISLPSFPCFVHSLLRKRFLAQDFDRGYTVSSGHVFLYVIFGKNFGESMEKALFIASTFPGPVHFVREKIERILVALTSIKTTVLN